MDQEIQIFKHEQFGKVRVIIINGEPWFVAVDVCKVLELRNVSRALSRLAKSEKSYTIIPARGVTSSNTQGGEQKMLIVN